jgi:hypothetical protein
METGQKYRRSRVSTSGGCRSPSTNADDMRHINDFVDTLRRVIVAAIGGTRKAIDAEASPPVDVAGGRMIRRGAG